VAETGKVVCRKWSCCTFSQTIFWSSLTCGACRRRRVSTP